MLNTFKITLWMLLLTLLCVAVGKFLLGWPGALLGVLLALAMNVLAYCFSERFVLKYHKARRVERRDYPLLCKTVRELSERAQLPMPAVYVIPDYACNAFAAGRDSRHASIAVTEGLLAHLTPDELSGVIAHELAHIHNRDILLSTLVASMVATLTLMANRLQSLWRFRSSASSRNPLAWLTTIVVMPVAAILLQLGISRSREYEADRVGAVIHGRPSDLASALLKLDDINHDQPDMHEEAMPTSHLFIVNPIKSERLRYFFSMHPSVKKRVERLMNI